ncbi:MAG: hypothetical protein GSR86_01935 [Desulfurococcales archaeon]|nr:hypothetical protein [Desulfurococcales archaeon]
MDYISLFEEAGSAIVSDAMGRGPSITGLKPVSVSRAVAGPALTVSVPPGDWLLAIEAVDHASPGDVIVIDAGVDVARAVWGGLASLSASIKGLKATIVHGFVRDTRDIARLGYPVYAYGTSPTAGNPRGMGSIGEPVTIQGITIRRGDIVVADPDGVVVVPIERVDQVAARVREVMEIEEKIKAYIESGKGTLYTALAELGLLGKAG